MKRRDMLQLAASSAALAFLPKDCHLPWQKVGQPLVGAQLTADQKATVRAYADALLPRTATPGALDVKVPEFVDVIVADQYMDAEREGLAAGLGHLEAAAQREGGAFATLAPAARTRVLEALERPVSKSTPATRGYQQLRALLLHGYFTSAVVQRDILKVNVMPGRFDGQAPVAGAAAASAGGTHAHG